MDYQSIIYQTAINNGLPDLVAKNLVAQSMLESSYDGIPYNSPVFLNNNNSFGYKYVGQSLATQGTLAPQSEWPSPTQPGYYAKYANVSDSALEVIKWIKRRINEGVFQMSDLYTPEGYANAFKKAGYFTTTAANYSNMLKSLLTKVVNFAKNNTGLTILAIIFVAYLVKKNIS